MAAPAPKWLSEKSVSEALNLAVKNDSGPSPNSELAKLVTVPVNSVKRPIDNEKFKQYFRKRKAKSNWSKINKDKVKALFDQGLMQKAGFQSIEIAKENGSWTILDGIEALEMPEDLHEALTKHEGVFDFFDNLSKSVKKILLYWVYSVKREETRQKRVLEIVENASKGLKPKQFR